MMSKMKCSVPGCTIEFSVSDLKDPEKTICMICELRGFKEEKNKLKAIPFVCINCKQETCPLTSYSCKEQKEGECYDCFLQTFMATRQKSKPCPPGGPITEQKSTMINVFIKTLTGRIITIQVQSDDFVYDIMKEIDKKEGMPYNAYTLVFLGNRLIPHYSLEFYKIQDESNIHLVSNLRGS